jgi:hypothetical protein
MSSNKSNDIKLDDLPAPSDLMSVDSLPSPEELGGLQSEEPGKLESLARGAEQGLSFGFGDEINAALESALTDKTYKQAVQESRNKFDAAEKANPITSIGGTLLGSIIPAGVVAKGVGLGANALKAALPMAQDTSMAAKLAELISLGTKGQGGIKGLASAGVATGAVEGGLQGLGATEDLSKAPGNLPKDIAIGSTIGGIGGAGAGVLGKLLRLTKSSELFKAGEEGTNLFDKDVVSGLGKQAREALLDVSKGAKNEINSAGASIRGALERTPATDVSSDMDVFRAAAEQVDTLKPYVNKVERLIKKDPNDPKSIYQVYKYVRDSAYDIGSSLIPDADKAEKMQILNELKNGIISKLDEASQEAVNAVPGAKSLADARTQYSKLVNVVERFAPGSKDKSSLDADTFSKVEKGLQNMLVRAEGDSTSGLVTKAELDEVGKALQEVSPDLANKFEAAKTPIETLALRKQAMASGNLIKTATGSGAHAAGLISGKVGGFVDKIPTPNDLFKPEVAAKVSNISPTLGGMMKRLQDTTISESKRRAYQNILLNNPIVRKALSEDSDK